MSSKVPERNCSVEHVPDIPPGLPSGTDCLSQPGQCGESGSQEAWAGGALPGTVPVSATGEVWFIIIRKNTCLVLTLVPHICPQFILYIQLRSGSFLGQLWGWVQGQGQTPAGERQDGQDEQEKKKPGTSGTWALGELFCNELTELNGGKYGFFAAYFFAMALAVGRPWPWRHPLGSVIVSRTDKNKHVCTGL